jgi:hypothetical protein
MSDSCVGKTFAYYRKYAPHTHTHTHTHTVANELTHGANGDPADTPQGDRTRKYGGHWSLTSLSKQQNPGGGGGTPQPSGVTFYHL